MGYASDKQRKFMHVARPDIAKKWDAEESKRAPHAKEVGEIVKKIHREHGINIPAATRRAELREKGKM